MTAMTTVPMSATLPDLARALTDAGVTRLVDRVRAAPADDRPGVAVWACYDVAELLDLAAAWGCPEAVDVPAAVRRLALAATPDGEPCDGCGGEGVVWQESTAPIGGLGFPCDCTGDLFYLDVPSHRARMEGIARDAPSLRQGSVGDEPLCPDCLDGLPLDGGAEPPDGRS